MKKFVNDNFNFMWHGGDYNPDQWLKYDGIVDKDFALFDEAKLNSISVGIFSWAALEPREGEFCFEWLDDIMDRAAEKGMAVVLATPSGSKPKWLSGKYPDTRRVLPAISETVGGDTTLRELPHGRHNHCYTSPNYRRLITRINTQLALRYKNHPALAMWHVSNEFGGECRCPLCFAAFREWLKTRYENIEELNEKWCSAVWSHQFSSFDEITALDVSIGGMNLDWKRFISHQTVDFFRAESAPLREITPEIPVTVNMMGWYSFLNYRAFAPYIDIASWDNYPLYHDGANGVSNTQEAIYRGFMHDYYRSLKMRPFLVMESAPGPVNWMPVNRLLRPGVHLMKSLQGIAHGADSVQYFQMRKCRGGPEKYHAAVIDHVGDNSPRMFKEVCDVGNALEKLKEVCGAETKAKVAIVHDGECHWALSGVNGFSPFVRGDNNGGFDIPGSGYFAQNMRHYAPYWKRGVAVDIIDQAANLGSYSLVIAPTCFMLREGFAKKMKDFVRSGGTLVATYLTGCEDSYGNAFLGGFPGDGLQELFGIRAEETDSLYPNEENSIVWKDEKSAFKAKYVCERIHANAAEIFARYGSDFYAGEPAVTKNKYGEGTAWYLAAEGLEEFNDWFHARLIDELKLPRALENPLPEGVSTQVREDDSARWTFVMNYEGREVAAEIGDTPQLELLSGKEISGTIKLAPYQVLVLRKRKN